MLNYYFYFFFQTKFLECNCNPAGTLSTFAGCGSLPLGELCQCKPRVQGRICDECRELFWNLQPTNPYGCQGIVIVNIE